MNGKEFKAMASVIEDDSEVLFSQDEELNCIRKDGEIASLPGKKKRYVIYGFDGTEVDFNE